jgi:hypothetical protein
MRHTAFSIAVILFLSIAADSFGFMETRHQWWEARLKKITAEKARLDRDPAADRQVAALLGNEIRRARAVIAVFESDRRNDGSLTHESRAMTGADIAAEADAIVPPLCALRQLELMVSDEDDGARAVVRQRIEGMVAAAFNRGNADTASVTDRIIKEDILPGEWKGIATELRLGRIMEDGPRFREQCRDETVRAVADELARRGNAANGKELRSLVLRKAREIAGGYCLRPLATDQAVLDRSHTWQSVRSSLERDLPLYKTIMALAAGDTMPLERARNLLKHPDDCEPAFFAGERTAFEGLEVPAKGAAAGKSGERALDIPSLACFLPAIDEMKKMRASMILTLSGREDRQFFDTLRGKLESVIARHTSVTKKAFAREEQNLANERGSGTKPFVNEREFLNAKRSFGRGLGLLAGSAKKSVDLAVLVSSSRKQESGEVVSRYRYRTGRNREYLGFLTALASDCARLPVSGDPGSAKRFAAAYGKTGGVFTFAGASLSLDPRCRPYLSKQDRALVAGLMAESSAAIQSAKGDLRACHDRFSRAAAADAGSAKQGRQSLDEKIAQEDIDAHVRYAGECVALHERYRYAGEAFEKYGGLFDAFTRQARTGAVSSALEGAVKNASLISTLSDFDADRIRAEYDSRRFLRAEAVASLSRLATLVQFYRKHGVTARDVPSAEEIAALKGRLTPPAQTRIDSWVMNETNFRDVDRKAAQKLALLVGRGAHAGETAGAGENARPEDRTLIRLQEPALSLALPRGWEEEQVGETELYQGVIKSFHAGDGISSLQLVKLPLDNGDAKDAAEAWIKKGGYSLVEKQWRKANNLDCLVILSSDRKKNIYQTCALSIDGFAFLITGSTARNRYQSFRDQFMKIIGSVQAGKM